ncbi:hypothetical protein JW899_00425, partial [Candidatus Uhrbacteria bacterium]|nr:hypothetical protein [Candidatus Uhrbacteria bacterium]
MSKPTRQPAERSRFPSGRLIRAHGRFGFAAVALTVVLASALPPAVSVASGPSANMALNYQARITNSTGISLADGSKSVKFVIYDALSGGNCEYTARGTCSATESDQLGKDVTIANGSFSTVIGESGDNSLDGVFSGDEERYLEIRVYNGASYEIMSPRKRIVSSAFALNANLLDDLDTSNTGGSGAFVPVTDSTGNFTLTKNVNFAGGTFFIDASTSRVGIGDTDPAALFTVGSGGLFRVNSSGEVTAAAGITSSGSITFSGVASGVVVADASGVLSGGHLIDLTADVNGILAVANGGTGASSLTDGGILLGSGTGAVTAMSVLGDGAIVIGDGTTDPVPLSAFTSSTGYLKHEYGGLEADVSAITTGGLFRGTGAGTVGILAVGNEGQVLTAQADGSVIWEDASGGGDMAIGGTVTSGTAGSILFVGSGPVLA